MSQQQRLAELEALIQTKQTTLSKTGYRSWMTYSNEYREYINVKTAVANAECRQQQQQRAQGGWKSEPATSNQINYLRKLGVVVDRPLTKGAASELIDSAKRHADIGSFGMFYSDGSN